MGRPPIGKAAMSAAERQRRHRARFSDVTEPRVMEPDAAAARLKELEAELAQANARIAELEKALHELRLHHAERSKTATELAAKLHIMKQRKAPLSASMFKQILTCLHPDSRHSTSDEKLAKAFDGFNRCEWLFAKPK